MNCFPELTYAVFVDGELSPEEARRIEAHLLACPGCRAQVEALRAESRLLFEMLQEAEPEAMALPVAQPPRVRWMDLAWTTAVILGVAGSAQAAYNWLSGVETPAGTGWLNPFNLGLQLNLFFKSAFYFLDEGVTMLTSMSLTIATLVLACGAIAGAVVLVRRRQMPHMLLMTLTAIFALLLAAAPASAVEQRSVKKGDVVVRAEETIDDTLIIHARKITIDGTVTGNVIAFGDGVEVGGTVKGDLICFAGGVNIKGRVDGNIFVFTGGLDLNGSVGQSVYAFAGGVKLNRDAQIAGDLVAFTGGADAEGTVNRDLVTFSGGTSLSGTVGRNLMSRSDGVSIGPGARVGGNVNIQVKKPENAKVDPAATIGGKKEIKIAEGKGSRYAHPPFYMQATLGLGIVFLLGLFLRWLWPFLFTGGPRTAGDVGRAAGIGFVAWVVPPVAACVLGIILIGIGILADVVLISILIPILIMVVWLLALYLSKVFVGLSIGQLLLRAGPGNPRFAASLVAGLFVVYVAINLPFIGGMLNLIVWILGLGIATVAAWRHYKRPAAA